MKTCDNCGGVFKKTLPKCPYCGAINPEGAEKEYNNKLNNIREKLDVVDELAVEEYKNGLKLFFKTFFVVLPVFAILAAIWFFIEKGGMKNISVRPKPYEPVLVSIEEANERFKEWNDLHDKERYSDLYELVNAYGYSEMNSNWVHSNFYQKYYYISEIDKGVSDIKAGKKLGSYTLQDILWSLIYLEKDLDGEELYGLTKEDFKILKEEFYKRKDDTLKAIDMTYPEYASLYGKAVDDGRADYTTVSEYAKERWGN